MALAVSPHPSAVPMWGPVTHVSCFSGQAWLRLVASLYTCSGSKLHSLSLRAEGKGQSLGEACEGYYPASSQFPAGSMVSGRTH